MPKDPYQKLDATAQAALVAKGDASAKQLVEAAIARIERLEPTLNVSTSLRFEKAVKQAEAIDVTPQELRGPFAGVPFLVKDLDPLAGEPLNFGSELFRYFRAGETEPVIAAAQAAGLVAVGKSNTPEFGLISTTEPLLHGPTRNPWDISLSPGGSSGGAAAAVASGMVPIAHATDGGGSIRIPAASCGLVGLKPSRGRGLKINRDSPGNISVALCVSRSVRDTARFLDISDAERARQGQEGAPEPIGFVEGAPERPLRIALAMNATSGAAPEPEVRKAVEAAAKLCESLGHHVEEAAPALDGELATRRFLTLWSSVADTLRKNFFMVRAYARGLRVWTWPSYENAFDPWTRGLAEMFQRNAEAEPDQVEKAHAFIAEVERAYEAFFGSYDLLLSPVLRQSNVPLGATAPTVPFDTLMERVTDNVGYTPIFNAIGWPAVSLPLGIDGRGLPIGVQFAAPRYEEERLLRLAYQLEAAAPWASRWPFVM